MKLQYLGDSKDAFKWDYLDFLARHVDVTYLDIIPMKTPDDRSGEGKTPSSRFPSSESVQKFCHHLKGNRSFDELRKLPRKTGGKYEVRLHKPNHNFKHVKEYRDAYFSDMPCEQDSGRVLFLDPDIGFQPPKTVNNKHVEFADLATIWPQITDNSIVCVFQHGRRMQYHFEDHYKEIKRGLKRIEPFYSTAVYWCNDLMFVLLGKHGGRIERARVVTGEYQKQPRPVQLIHR